MHRVNVGAHCVARLPVCVAGGGARRTATPPAGDHVCGKAPPSVRVPHVDGLDAVAAAPPRARRPPASGAPVAPRAGGHASVLLVGDVGRPAQAACTRAVGTWCKEARLGDVGSVCAGQAGGFGRWCQGRCGAATAGGSRTCTRSAHAACACRSGTTHFHWPHNCGCATPSGGSSVGTRFGGNACRKSQVLDGCPPPEALVRGSRLLGQAASSAYAAPVAPRRCCCCRRHQTNPSARSGADVCVGGGGRVDDHGAVDGTSHDAGRPVARCQPPDAASCGTVPGRTAC